MKQANRLERRTALLRGKRGLVFDPNQRYLGTADRARAARKVRVALRRMQPVLLVTPRWSQAPRFLDDLATDLAIGEPKIQARPLSLGPLLSRNAHESWTWLAHAMAEFCEIKLEGPIAQAVDRHGFRNVLGRLFRHSTHGPRRALLIHGVEHLHVEARDDLLRVFNDHVDEAGDMRRVVLLLAGSVDAPQFDLPGADRIVLPDFARAEAVEALAEYVGSAERHRLDTVVGLLGGVPALLDRVGAAWEKEGRTSADKEALWRALGPLADEVRGAVAIVSAVDGLADRLEQVSREGAIAEDTQWDRMLVRAGLFALVGAPTRRVSLRAPLFADVAGSR